MNRYVIDGPPVSWKRPGGLKTRYDTQKHEKLSIGLAIINQHNNRPFFSVPINMDLYFFIKHPQCSPKKELEIMGKYCISRPDLDNYIKLILDICTGILYLDDNIVVSIFAKKVYDPIPRTEIIIRELND